MIDEEAKRRFDRIEAATMMLLSNQNIIIAVLAKIAGLEDDENISMTMNVNAAALQAMENNLKEEGYVSKHDA